MTIVWKSPCAVPVSHAASPQSACACRKMTVFRRHCQAVETDASEAHSVPCIELVLKPSTTTIHQSLIQFLECQIEMGIQIFRHNRRVQSWILFFSGLLLRD